MEIGDVTSPRLVLTPAAELATDGDTKIELIVPVVPVEFVVVAVNEDSEV